MLRVCVRISAFDHEGDWGRADGYFAEMKEAGLAPNLITYSAMISISISLSL